MNEKDNKDNVKHNEKNFIIMILILIALIIIIFLLINELEFINHKPRVPTGNVDIFDIIFKCDNCECIGDSSNSIEVFDEDTNYSTSTKLNIFTNTAYYVTNDTIAPTSENSYQFVVRNHNGFNIKYNLEINENNKYNINMKYRLKLNGLYVAGSNNKWVTYKELNQYDIELSDNTYDVYTLDWKWFEGSNDTSIGQNINSYYKLNLKIVASLA